MQLSQVLPLLSAIFIFFLGNFVFWGNRRQKINIVFALFCFGSTIWFFGTFMMFISGANVELALFWDRIVYLGVALLPAFMYHLSLILTHKKETKTLYFGYILLTLFLILSQTHYFIDGIYTFSWGVHSQARILHHFFLLTFFVYVALFYFNIYPYYKQTKNRLEKLKLRFVLAAFVFLTLGALGYLPAYGIDIYPFSYFFGVVFAIIFAYAILKLRFISIKLAVKKTTVYVTSMITTVSLTFLFWWLFNNTFAVAENHAYIITLIFALVLATPLHKLIEKYSNKYLFYSLETYQQTIISLANKLNTIIDLDKIIDLVVDTIKATMSLDRSGVLLIDDDVQPVKYHIAKVVGFNEKNGISLVQDNFLTQYLTKTQKPLVKEEFDFLSEQAEKSVDKQSFITLKDHMSKIEASLCLPLISQNKLAGIIVLGAKTSGEAYTKEDLDLLTVLANQAAVAITNARYYKETKDFNATLQTKVDDQTRDIKQQSQHLQELLDVKNDFLRVANHQLNTPLSVVRNAFELMQDKTYTAKQAMEAIQNGFERLNSVIGDFLKAYDLEGEKMEMKAEPVDMSAMIERLLPEKQKLKLAVERNLKLSIEKPKFKIPLVFCDPKQIINVISNLLDNAVFYTNKGSVTVSYKLLKSDHLKVNIQDTGAGITEEDKKSMFQKFVRGKGATQLHPDGSGLGLYIAKKIVEGNNGEINVTSQGPNKGSTFSFTLPVYENQEVGKIIPTPMDESVVIFEENN